MVRLARTSHARVCLVTAKVKEIALSQKPLGIISQHVTRVYRVIITTAKRNDGDTNVTNIIIIFGKAIALRTIIMYDNNGLFFFLPFGNYLARKITPRNNVW